MPSIAEMMLLNSLGALVLAVFVFAVCKLPFLRFRPAVHHFLWAVVLIKLIAPPLIGIELIPKLSVSNWQTNDKSSVATFSDSSAASEGSSIHPKTSAVLLEVKSSNTLTLNWRLLFLVVSILGCCFLTFVGFRQIRRFNTLIRTSARLDQNLSNVARQVGERMSIGNVPKVYLVPVRISPLLWAFGKQPMIVIPDQMIECLQKNQIEGVIAHEVAHFHRRDQWTNLFSLLLASLFWWNPVAWVARRQLQISQESCCDAMVLEGGILSRNAYAKTVLAVVEHLQDFRCNHPAHPALGNEFNNFSKTKRRISVIAKQNLNHRVSKWHSLIVLAALIALPCFPKLVSAQEIELKECPEAVQRTILSQARDGQVIEVEMETNGDAVIYEAEVVNGTNVFDLTVRANGLLVSKIFERPVSKKDDDGDDEGDDDDGDDGDGDDDDGDDGDGDDDDGDDGDGDDDDGDDGDGDDDDGDDGDGDDDDGDDGDGDDDGKDDGEDSTAFTMDQLPAAVRTTLQLESVGAEIEDLEREVEKGKTIFSADLEYDTDFGELEYEIEISEDGTLIHKVLKKIELPNDEDDDDGDDDADDDK